MGISNVATSLFQLNVTFSNWETKTQKDRLSSEWGPSMTKQVARDVTLQLTLLDFRMPWCFQLLMLPVLGNACLHTWVGMKWLIPLALTMRPIIWRGPDHYRLIWPGLDSDKISRLISVCRINHININLPHLGSHSQWFYRVYILLSVG